MSDLDPGVHPVVRDALRLCITGKEYRFLHEHAVRRAPAAVRKQTPSPARFEAIVRPRSKYNEAAIRSSLRVFLGSGAALKLVGVVMRRIQGGAAATNQKRVVFFRSPNFRLSLALSLVLLLHRFLHRFFARLRVNLRTDEAQPFRNRNPHLAKTLTSRYAPAVGASMAGFALGVAPQAQLRMSAAVYMSTRSLEFLYNVMDEKGWLENRPWWFGSWMLMPVSCAQLFHAFVFDRETTPGWFGKVIMGFSPSYIQDRPELLPAAISWPGKEEVVDSVANIANLRWPPFISPILHPGIPNTLPSAISSISPITGPAHPSITSLSCALLHAGIPSCSTAFLHHILLSVPRLARFITSITLALSVLRHKSFVSQPLTSVQNLSKRIITLTAILSAAVGSTWGSLCFWNTVFKRTTLPTKRFFLSGALGGLPFAFLGNSRATSMYFLRAAVDSAWKTGVKRGLWKGWAGGELWLVVVSWAVLGSMLETRPGAVQGPGIRKGLAWMRGEGYVDPVDVMEKKKAKKAAKKEGQA